MIKLKIIKSQDYNQIGDFIFGKNRVLFSSSSKADVLSPVDFAIEIIDDSIFLLNPSNKVLIDNKFSGELSKINMNKTIGIDDFQIQIINFNFTYKLTTRELLNKNTEYIIKNKPDLLKKITDIRNEIIDAQ